MPLEWKTTKLYTLKGQVKVTHWKKHSPRALLTALKSKPEKEFPESTPAVKFHKFGGQTIVARTTVPGGLFVPIWPDGGTFQCMPPKQIFDILKELAEKKAAFVEMPVALVERKTTHTLVTLTKPHRASLEEVLSADDVPESKKRALAVKAIKLFARLNALGYWHSHPGSHNVVVMKNGEVRLIDPTLLGRFPKAGLWNIDRIEARSRLSQPFRTAWGVNDPQQYRPSERLDSLMREFDSANYSEIKRVKAKQRV